MVLAQTLISLLPLLSYVAAQDETPVEEKRVGGPLGYIPNKGAAVIFCIVYAVVAAHGTWMMFRVRGKYMATLVVSGYIYALGLILRLPFSSNTDSLGLYIIMNLCTVLSPCGFIATVYVLLGRLASHLHAEDLLLIRPGRITKLYVTSDVITLLIQASGGSMAAMDGMEKLSTKIFLVGLILQLISFASYMIVFSVFIHRVKTWRRPQWDALSEKVQRSHWKGLALAMAISCLGITIRCIYRTVEGGQGFDGYLLTHEVYFYILDCFPLFCAVVVYNYVWPPTVFEEKDYPTRLELSNNNSNGNV